MSTLGQKLLDIKSLIEGYHKLIAKAEFQEKGDYAKTVNGVKPSPEGDITLPTQDLSNYYTKEETTEQITNTTTPISTKVDELTQTVTTNKSAFDEFKSTTEQKDVEQDAKIGVVEGKVAVLEGSNFATETFVTNKIEGLGTLFTYKGSKDTYSQIESIPDAKAGDVWNDTATGHNYVRTSEGQWDRLAPNAVGASVETSTPEEVGEYYRALTAGDSDVGSPY